VHRVINRSLGLVLPRNLQKAALEGLFSIGRAQVSDYILNEKNPLGSLRLARLRSILDEGKSLQLQFPAEDLGFRLVSPEQIIVHNIYSFLSLFSPLFSYWDNVQIELLAQCHVPDCTISYDDLSCAFSYEEGALVPEDPSEVTQKAEKLKHSNRSSRYIPSVKVGSRLPHMLVKALSASDEVCPWHT
jgi:hypothetical protein